MGNDDLLTDDYVADLLAKEASDCSLKYSTMGMEAYTSSSSSSSRPANKFKPNTRFLRNIIKGTNRHNEALLAKEQSESQARLRDLADAEEEKRRKYRPSAGEMRGRQLGNIAALLTGRADGAEKKRKRPSTEKDDDEVSELQKSRAQEDARRLADMEAARKRHRDRDGGKRKRSLERYNVRKGKGRSTETRIQRNSSSEEDEPDQEEPRRRHKHRSRSRSRSPKSSHTQHRQRSPLRERRHAKSRDKSVKDSSKSRHSKPKNEETKEPLHNEAEDSDPLDDLIGPAPPPNVKPRGRGAHRGALGMDNRFATNYDPSTDVQLEDTVRDDWDDSLEALRDRAKFRQQGASRLREAGFTEEQVKKWEKGGEKSIEDVQWTKAGEKREWDRGKDIDNNED